MLMAAARGDLIEKAGLKMPTTFDELMKVCEAANNKDGVSAYVADRLHHWDWIPFLMGFGGTCSAIPRRSSPDPRHAGSRECGRILCPADTRCRHRA